MLFKDFIFALENILILIFSIQANDHGHELTGYISLTNKTN